VDVENSAVPVGVDAAGNVDRSSYPHNHFDDINGKCIDLDSLHDGEVHDNRCYGFANFGIVMTNSNPDMRSRNIAIVDNHIDGACYRRDWPFWIVHLRTRTDADRENLIADFCVF